MVSMVDLRSIRLNSVWDAFRTAQLFEICNYHFSTKSHLQLSELTGLHNCQYEGKQKKQADRWLTQMNVPPTPIYLVRVPGPLRSPQRVSGNISVLRCKMNP